VLRIILPLNCSIHLRGFNEFVFGGPESPQLGMKLAPDGMLYVRPSIVLGRPKQTPAVQQPKFHDIILPFYRIAKILLNLSVRERAILADTTFLCASIASWDGRLRG